MIFSYEDAFFMLKTNIKKKYFAMYNLTQDAKFNTLLAETEFVKVECRPGDTYWRERFNVKDHDFKDRT
jgi:hypothetical protein